MVRGTPKRGAIDGLAVPGAWSAALLLALLLPAAASAQAGPASAAASAQAGPASAAASAQAGPASASPAKPKPRLNNRLTVGLLFDVPEKARGLGLEILLSDRFRLTIDDPRTGIRTTVHAAGRLGLRPARGLVDRARIRSLGVTLHAPTWRAELGRSAVIDGGWRLVDGVQFLVRPTHGGPLEVGGWLGEMPDIWTTAPAPRFGGGPIVRLRTRTVQIGFVGEVGGGAGGIDRVSGRLTGRVELKKLVDISARAEVEAGGLVAPVRFSELGVSVIVDPVPLLRARVAWSMHSGHAWLQGIDRDPNMARWWRRLTGAAPTAPLPWEEGVDGPTHQILGAVDFTPTLGTLPARFGLNARYNHRTVDRERSARVAVHAGLYDLADRLDLQLTAGALRWHGRWRSEAGLRGWLAIDRRGFLSVEAGGRVWVGANEHGDVVPTVATDLWLDVLTPVGVSIAGGYRFDNDLDIDRWNAAHTLLLRASWSLRSDRRRTKKGRSE